VTSGEVVGLTHAQLVDLVVKVSYGPRVRAIVVYLLGRQHVPNQRTAEAMADLFGIPIATGTVDAIYTGAGRRLGGFIVALVATGG